MRRPIYLHEGLLSAVTTLVLVTTLGSIAASPRATLTATNAAPEMVMVPTGDLVSVQLHGDIGSRISNEGDAFAVTTIEDYYVKGKLVLPKGTPGYGAITHIKRAGAWHSGGELTFTVKRLVAPDGSTIGTETNGATSDADKQSEKNGNEAGQYLLWGPIGIFTHRGNDILIKDGALFHIAIADSKTMPVITYGTKPIDVNWTIVNIHPATPAPQQ